MKNGSREVVSVSLALPVGMADAMREKAREAERSLSAEVRIALREYLEKSEKEAA